MAQEISLTPTQARLLQVLNDGATHRREELVACLDDELSDLINFYMHIHKLRAKLRVIGQVVTCTKPGDTWLYQLGRNVASSNDGRS